MRQGGRAYFAANMVSQAAALIRYVLLARLLGPEQLGIAALLILTAQFFESISDTGSDRFLVQDDDGDDPKMQGLVQLVLAARGVLIALALALSAGLFARLYNMPDLTLALIALGVAPLIGGFIHLDLRRAQRTSDFRPESIAMIVSEAASLIATAVAAWMTRDHTAVIYGLAVRAACLVIVSHVVAKRPYRWSLTRDYATKFSAFALPLAANGVLLFFGSQGDRVVIGSTLGAEALGHYSAVLLLAYYPASMIGRYLSGLHLPQIARSRTSTEDLQVSRWRLASQFLLLAAAMVAGFAFAAPIVTPLLYGASFQQPWHIFALLGLLQAARFLRLWPTALAVGTGRSAIVMQNNIARMSALPLAFATAQVWASLEAIMLGFIFGELLALFVALALLARHRTVDMLEECGRVALFMGLAASLVAAAWFGDQSAAEAMTASAFLALSIIAAVAYTERRTLRGVWQMARSRLGRTR